MTFVSASLSSAQAPQFHQVEASLENGKHVSANIAAIADTDVSDSNSLFRNFAGKVVLRDMLGSAGTFKYDIEASGAGAANGTHNFFSPTWKFQVTEKFFNKVVEFEYDTKTNQFKKLSENVWDKNQPSYDLPAASVSTDGSYIELHDGTQLVPSSDNDGNGFEMRASDGKTVMYQAKDVVTANTPHTLVGTGEIEHIRSASNDYEDKSIGFYSTAEKNAPKGDSEAALVQKDFWWDGDTMPTWFSAGITTAAVPMGVLAPVVPVAISRMRDLFF